MTVDGHTIEVCIEAPPVGHFEYILKRYSFTRAGFLQKNMVRLAMFDLGIVVEREEIDILFDHIGAEGDDITYEDFNRLVNLHVLMKKGFSLPNLKKLFVAVCNDPKEMCLDFSVMGDKTKYKAIQELEFCLRKHSISLDLIRKYKRLDLEGFERAVADEIKISKIAEWLQSIGILHDMAGVLPLGHGFNDLQSISRLGVTGIESILAQNSHSFAVLIKRHADYFARRCHVNEFDTCHGYDELDQGRDHFTATASDNSRPSSFHSTNLRRKSSCDSLCSSNEKFWKSNSEAMWATSGFEEKTVSRTDKVLGYLLQCYRTFIAHITLSMIFWTVLCCACLVAGGIALILTWVSSFQFSQDRLAHMRAQEVANFFVTEIGRAAPPLATLSTLVQHSRTFLDLPALVANATHKDVSLLQPSQIPPAAAVALQAAIDEIRATNAVPSSLISVQLSPRGIVSLASPVSSSSPPFRTDVFRDPLFRDATAYSVASGRMSMSTPISLPGSSRRVLLVNYPIFVQEALAGSLPLASVGLSEYHRNGTFWGFASAVLDFDLLANMSKIESKFGSADLIFNLTTTRHVLQPDSSFLSATEVLLSTPEASPIHGGFVVTIDLAWDNWNLTVSHESGFKQSWYVGSLAGVLAGSVFFSSLLLLLLLSHKQYSKLLYRIMPRHAVHRLQQGQQVVEVFDDVTVFFCDIVGFTDLAGQSSPLEVVALLNDLYTKFDKLVDNHGVCKVDTIGDAYMVVGGAPDRCKPTEAAAKVAKFALDALEEVARSGHAISMRAGMASGPVVAGVLGTSVPKYSIFGDTVNTASRMESTGKAGLLQATEHTRDLLLESSSRFEIEERVHANGQKGIMVKGKGIMNTCWVRSVSE